MPAYDERTALVVVDVQNDFADPEGNLSVPGGHEIVPRVNEEVATATAAGALVVYTQDWHPPDTPHFEKDGGTWPVHCVRDTWGAELHPDLVVRGDVLRKGGGGWDGYSGFSIRDPETGEVESTGLAEHLAERGTERIVVVGLATDYCVKETALEAVEQGYAATVVRDAIAAVDLDPGDGQAAIEAMAVAGVTVE